MLKKARIRLTLFSGGITTLILIIMTLGYLYISEKNLLKNRNYSYQNEIYNIAVNLEQQNTITHAWLSQLEAGSNYYISLLDNQTPFLFNVKPENSLKNKVSDKIWLYYRKNETDMKKNVVSYKCWYKSFLFSTKTDTSVTNLSCYCFVITVCDYENENKLEMLLIAPLSDIQSQFFRQRLIFSIIIIAALTVIWIFTWVFVGRLLCPIEENRIKQNQFIAAASHELRTPLAVILSSSEAATEKIKTDKIKSEYQNIAHDISTIKSEALRTSRLLTDMLTLSSHDSYRFNIQKSETELDTLLINTCETFESMTLEKEIKLIIELPDTVLPHCICDSERITQVISILLNNAISYTPNGGKIFVSLHYKKNIFEIKVSDTGVGIPDNEKNKIFDRFYRGEKSRSDNKHFGLGLSIAHEIITAHKGSITVSDTPGGGATFTILLK